MKSEDIMDDMLVANICKVGDKEKIDRMPERLVMVIIIHHISAGYLPPVSELICLFSSFHNIVFFVMPQILIISFMGIIEIESRMS